MDFEKSVLFAPAEQKPAVGRIIEELKNARETKTYLKGFGVTTGDEVGLLTLGGQDVAYGSGWRHAATRRVPDISVYGSHEMIAWARDAQYAINLTRHYVHHHTRGEKILKSPHLLVDLEAGWGSVAQTFNLVYKLCTEVVPMPSMAHIENQNPNIKACGHQLDFEYGGKKKKEPKALIPRKEWLAKLRTAREAAVIASRDTYNSYAPTLILARSDSADGILENGKATTLDDAVDDIIAAHEEVGIQIGWIEYNTTELKPHMDAAEKIMKRCPSMLGMAVNVSPNKYTEPHEVRSNKLASVGYVLDFSTIPINLTNQISILKFMDDFDKEPFEAVLKISDEKMKISMHERYDGIFKGQAWVGTNWWRALRAGFED